VASRGTASIFGRIADIYYSRTQLGESAPQEGPVIFVANHPNGLIDPLIVGNVAKRRMLFLAKAPLFKIPLIGWLAAKSGAIPVYRKIDGDATERNAQMFVAVHQALARGEAICLFPEGISHNEPNLQPLKTGAARMALGAEAAVGFQLQVKIVPVGLTYRSKTRFQSSVIAEVGRAIHSLDYLELYQQDEWQAVQKLTKDIARGIQAVTMNLEHWKDLPLLQLAEKLVPADHAHRVQRLRSFAHAGFLIEQSDPERLQRLRERLSIFAIRLDSYGLKVEQLDAAYQPLAVVAFIMRNLLAILIGLPLALIGGLVYGLPFLLVDLVNRKAQATPDIEATVKIIAAMVFFGLWQILIAWLCLHYWGWAWALAATALIPLAGLYARHFTRRRRHAWRLAKVFLSMPFRGRKRRLLQTEKDRLRLEIMALADAAEAAETARS
jgi:glycerol-3-phosphate O-acyltransferase / dihydroxyacetone phosphate acyltransferase